MKTELWVEMKKRIMVIIFLLGVFFINTLQAMEKTDATPLFKVLVLTERGGQHGGFTNAALAWLKGFARENRFEVTEINNTSKINEVFLAEFKVFIQLDFLPYTWSDESKKAFERYIEEGRGGWVGFHHATLLGDFDGYPMWDWFSDFMGGIRFKNYIAPTASAKVELEQHSHPVMKGVSKSFTLPHDEWYTFDRSPRRNVRVLAHVDESSYEPASNIKMGDHPVVWVNEKMKARNVYFLMGHHEDLLKNKDFTTMFGNAVLWAAGPAKWFPRFKVLAFYNPYVETAHREFARDAMDFLHKATYGEGFICDTTSNWNKVNDATLRNYQLVVSLNDLPAHTQEQRMAFQRYMENGGGWMGFHSANFNMEGFDWQWFVDFIGGSVFYRNNWPPQPAKLVVDDPAHPVVKGMPSSYISPANEWYQWKPSPRERKNVKVLLTLSPENYPIGLKDIIPDGDLPVVWTNTDYRMIYLNMGHGDRIFCDPTQNYLFFNALKWIISTNKKGNPFQ